LIKFVRFLGRRHSNFTWMSLPASNRKSTTADPTWPLGVVTAIFIAFSFHKVSFQEEIYKKESPQFSVFFLL